ncbi:CsbD-like domain-containing protein [Flavobacterium jumunjinense]
MDSKKVFKLKDAINRKININFKTNIMNTTDLKGKWNQVKGKLKQEYADLTENDLLYEEGKEEELYGRIQERIGKSKDEIKKWIADL